MVDVLGALKGISPSTIGAYAILIGLVIGFIKGWLVPGTTHDRVVAERDRYLEMATRGMELAQRVADVAGAPAGPSRVAKP